MSSPFPQKLQPTVQPRWSERMTALFTFLTAALIAAAISLGFFSASVLGNIMNVVGDDETIATTINAQICGDWATFVLDQNKNGLTAAQIENVWKVTTASSGAAQEKPMTELCGTIPDLLTAAGRS